MTCALYSTPSWFGTVSKSVSAAAIASSWASCEDEPFGLRCVGAAEDRLRVLVDVADVITVFVAFAEVRAVHIAHECEDAPADGDACVTLMASLLATPLGRRGCDALA